MFRQTAFTAAILVFGAPSFAGTQSSTPPQTQSVQTSQDLDRIKAALARPNTLILTDSQVRFYVEVVEKWPSVEEMFRGVDLINGPTRRGAPMTHAEYLGMVTPKEMHGSAGIKPGELLQFAVTNWFGQMLVRKALEEIRNARDANEIQKIRDRIDRELAALIGRGGR
jgi:hypothetical protein